MRISCLEKLGKEKLQEIVDNSNSVRSVMYKCGLSLKGTGNYKTVKKIFAKLNINTEKLENNKREYQIKSLPIRKAIPLEKVLIENSTYSRQQLKNRLIREKILEEKCHKCNILPFWDNAPLSLQIDHKNGKFNDNRIENLQLLCPNCHSQTTNFSGKSLKSKPTYCKCGKEKLKESQLCIDCSRKQERFSYRKVKNRPCKQELEKMISELPWTAIGKKYGVSDNAVRKWARKYSII